MAYTTAIEKLSTTWVEERSKFQRLKSHFRLGDNCPKKDHTWKNSGEET